MDDDLVFNKFVCGFVRKYPHHMDTQSDVRAIYIKQSDSGEYVVKCVFAGGARANVSGSETKFMVTALSTMTLMMAEFGIGHSWEPIKES